VASPTFVIAQELPTPAGLRLVHADWYRVEHGEELEAAGLSDWLAPRTLLAVEWGERFPEALPADRLEVRLEAEDEAGRRIDARAGGADSEALLACWRKRCP
jgi:tRNA threonylcarbamoyladenosine biosynthesis protein TsaE